MAVGGWWWLLDEVSVGWVDVAIWPGCFVGVWNGVLVGLGYLDLDPGTVMDVFLVWRSTSALIQSL